VKNKYPMKVLDRHTKNVIYTTIKKIIDNAKEEKKKAHIMSINLEWEEFRSFTPIQVMGLLLLRDVRIMLILRMLLKDLEILCSLR
jgi:hypothetical protein